MMIVKNENRMDDDLDDENNFDDDKPKIVVLWDLLKVSKTVLCLRLNLPALCSVILRLARLLEMAITGSAHRP